MREALRDIQERLPLNTFASTLLASGDDVPMRLGRNCVGQSRALAGELGKAGYKPSFISLARDTGTHYAVVTEEGGNLYFLDPSSLHVEPVNLTKMFREKCLQVVDSRPAVKGIPSTLYFEPTGKTQFTVSKTIYDGQKTYPTYSYIFDKATISTLLPRDDDAYIASRNEGRLTLRVSDGEGGYTVLKQEPNTGVRRLKRANAAGIAESTFTLADPDFLEKIQNVAGQLLMSPEDLRAHMDRGITSHGYVTAMVA